MFEMYNYVICIYRTRNHGRGSKTLGVAITCIEDEDTTIIWGGV